VARIAVVNDDTDFLTLMSEVLEEWDFEVVTIREAENAYSRLKADDPDLVILDIRMGSPEQGWTILELLTLDPATSHVPVIVCSAALDDLRSKEAWLRDHGISSLPKPFDIDDLQVAVSSAINRVGPGTSLTE
jgi:DNA-binding response OmpR family regulator